MEQQAARGACGLQLSGVLLGRRTVGVTGSRSKEAEAQQLRPGSDKSGHYSWQLDFRSQERTS